MFFDNFVRLCEQKGVKPSRTLTEAGVPKSAYSYWRTEASSGNDAKPTNQNAVKLAQYFNVTVDYLLTGHQNRPRPRRNTTKYADFISGTGLWRSCGHETKRFVYHQRRKHFALIVELSQFLKNIPSTFIHILYTYRANLLCQSVPHRL